MNAVNETNVSLEEERKLREVERRSITLSVRWPWHVKVANNCPVLWDCPLTNGSPHAPTLPVKFLEESRDLKLRVDGQKSEREVVTLLHEKALELLAKCHADTTSDNPDMRKTSREEEVVFLKQLLSKCTCLNAYQACEHDGSDTALTVFPTRKDDADTSKRSLALAMDVFHPADKNERSTSLDSASHNSSRQSVSVAHTSVNHTPLEVLCWSGKQVGGETFEPVMPDDIYLSRLILLEKKRAVSDDGSIQYHVREIHDFYPQWNLRPC